MSLKIRLARGGAKKRPVYRIVVADARAPRDGRFIEKLGSYNPTLPDTATRFTIDAEKTKEWLAKGAQPTDRVARFLGLAGIIDHKQANNPNKAKPGKKAEERAAEKADKAEAAIKAAADAAAAAAEAKAAAKAAAEEAAANPAPAAEVAEEAPAETAAE